MTTSRWTGIGRMVACAAVLGVVCGRLTAEPGESRSRTTTSDKVYFSPNGGAAAAVVKAITGAQTSVDVAMYSINTGGDIFDALAAAAGRGLRMRMVLNDANADETTRAKSRKLEGIGVDVRFVTRTMHEKFALVDGKFVLSGSGNWSVGADTKYSENMVDFQKHPRLVAQFQGEFDYLWSIAKDFKPDGTIGKPEGTPAPLPANGAGDNADAYFTSTNLSDEGEGVVGSKIIELIQAAKSSILIAVAHLDNPGIADALVKLQQERNQNADKSDDIEVRVLVDEGEYSASISKVTDLERAKIPVRYKIYSMTTEQSRAQLMHHKYMIIDRATVVTGSYNWSRTAEFKNYENIVVIENNPKLTRKYVDEYQKLWGLNRDRYPAFLKAVLSKPGEPGYQRVLPLHFDSPYFDTPMALERKELQPVRSLLWRVGFFKSPGNSKGSYYDKERQQVVPAMPSGTFLGEGTGGPGILDSLPPGH